MRRRGGSDRESLVRGRTRDTRRSPVAGRRSPVAGRRSPVAGRRSPVRISGRRPLATGIVSAPPDLRHASGHSAPPPRALNALPKGICRSNGPVSVVPRAEVTTWHRDTLHAISPPRASRHGHAWPEGSRDPDARPEAEGPGPSPTGAHARPGVRRRRFPPGSGPATCRRSGHRERGARRGCPVPPPAPPRSPRCGRRAPPWRAGGRW